MKAKRLKQFFHTKNLRKFLGVGPHLLLTGLIIEGLTIIFHRRVSWPIRLSLETQILLTILCGAACLMGIIWTHRLIISIAANLSDKRNELIVTGPFAYVRHPLYASFMMTLPPLQIIWFADLLFFVPWIVIIFVSHTIVTFEERRLIEAFGEAYEDYRRNVPALIPYKGAAGKGLKRD